MQIFLIFLQILCNEGTRPIQQNLLQPLITLGAVWSRDIVVTSPQGPVSHWDGLRIKITPSSIRKDNCLDVVFMQLSILSHSLRKLSLLEIFKTLPP